MKVRIIRPILYNREHTAPGTILDVPLEFARVLHGSKKAELLEPLPTPPASAQIPPGYMTNFQP